MGRNTQSPRLIAMHSSEERKRRQ